MSKRSTIRRCSARGGMGIKTSDILDTASPGCAVAVAYWFKLSAFRNKQAHAIFASRKQRTMTACSVA